MFKKLREVESQLRQIVQELQIQAGDILPGKSEIPKFSANGKTPRAVLMKVQTA